MRNRIPSSFVAMMATAMLTAWSLSASAQVIIVQPNQDDSCAVSFDENWNQVNIGRYVHKRGCGRHGKGKGVCHLPKWDCLGAPVLVSGNNVNVVADGRLRNCSQVVIENGTDVSMSNAKLDGVLGGIMVVGGSNITVENLSFKTDEGVIAGRSLDIQGAQDVVVSRVDFKGDFDMANIQSSSEVSVDRSTFELSDFVGLFLNIFESQDVSFDRVEVAGGNALMSLFNAAGVSMSRSAIEFGSDASFPSVTAFDSSDISIDRTTIDRRDVASSECFRLSNVTGVTIESSQCLSDPANNSGNAVNLSEVSDYLITRNLFDANSGGVFISSNGITPENGEISRNTFNVTGPYGLFLSAVTELDVIRNHVTNILGTGSAGTWYYDQLTDGTPLVINFHRNHYSGFAINDECNSLTTICE